MPTAESASAAAYSSQPGGMGSYEEILTKLAIVLKISKSR
jgi:hypothetical protein